MIIDSRAPTRIDLAGGTLDLWPLHLFFDQPMTINLGIDLWAQTHLEAVISGTPNAVLRAEDQKFEQKVPWNVILGDEPLKLPPQLELHGKLLRFFARKRKTPPLGSLLVQTQARSPAGAGLGGSSTLSVSLAGALAAWSREGDAPNVALEGEDLIAIVRDIETTVIKVPAGVQDYYGAMFGGLQALQWNPGKHTREALPETTMKELEKRLLLFYSGQSRNSGINNWALFKQLIDGDSATKYGFTGIAEATRKLHQALGVQDWNGVGAAIAREWEFRRTLASGITTEQMDQAFAEAARLGAVGGKVCGAGGGGCFFLYLPESSDTPRGADQRQQIRTRLETLGVKHLPFKAVARGLEVKVTRA
jgi:D-glycero-alpha-D-manno-heptose-7-phosphate kinase